MRSPICVRFSPVIEKFPLQKFSLLKCAVTKQPRMLASMMASEVNRVVWVTAPLARAKSTTANAIICQASKNELSTENAMPRLRYFA